MSLTTIPLLLKESLSRTRIREVDAMRYEIALPFVSWETGWLLASRQAGRPCR